MPSKGKDVSLAEECDIESDIIRDQEKKRMQYENSRIHEIKQSL